MRDRVITLGAMLLLCALAFLMVRATLSRNLAAREPELALWWSPDNSRALLAAATARGKSGDTTSARELATRALVASPLQAGALDLLALLSADRPSEAERIVRLAAARSLHDIVAHRWLYDIEARAGRAPAALAEADILARLPRGQGTRDLLRDLVERSRSAPFENALVTFLGTRPPWRRDFLEVITSAEFAATRAVAFYESLRKQGGVSAVETELLTARLLRDGQTEQAYLEWLSSLSDNELQRVGPIYNGDFGRQPSGASFDWQITPVVGVSAAVRDAVSGPALQVEFSGTRVVYQHVGHFLVLLPGTYRMRFEQRAEDLATTIGLVWRVTCPGRATPLVTTQALAGTSPWHDVAVDFTVPENCPLQQLRLELPARTALDSAISGKASYRALRIEADP